MTSPEQAYQFSQRYEEHAHAAADLLRPLITQQPQFGIVLGSGLDDLVEIMDVDHTIAYADIDRACYFPKTTVTGHLGNLIIGKLEGVSIIGLQGRKHYYEGATLPYGMGMLESVFPVHVLANLGVPNYFVTNAAGGLNLKYKTGEAMALKSHVSLNVPNPLLGRRMDFNRVDGSQTWEFEPTYNVYDDELRAQLLNAMEDNSNPRYEGNYVIVPGKTYESVAECLMLRSQGIDAMGMSTVPEAIIAKNRLPIEG